MTTFRTIISVLVASVAFLCLSVPGYAEDKAPPAEIYFSTGWCPRPDELAELSKYLTLNMNQCCIRVGIPNDDARRNPDLLKPWAHHMWSGYYPFARCDGRYLSVEEDKALREAHEQQMKQTNTPPKPIPLKCPQCGFWHVSSSSDGLEGDIIIIDEENISIPNCGNFSYEVKSSNVRIGDRPNGNKYTMGLTLHQWNSSALCDDTLNLPWHMTATITGHFHEGGIGNFVLQRTENTDFIFISGWNSDREDPCGAGSGFGTVACMSIANARLFKALSIEVANAYSILITQPRRKRSPHFNPAFFSADVLAHCTIQNKESGGGSWPYAWALTCQKELLFRKLNEFKEWRSCIRNRKLGSAACTFPSEKFDRTIPRDE